MASIGICNGLNGNNLPSPRDVVRLYQSKGIGAMRLYAPDGATLNALGRTGIKVMVGVDDGTLQDHATNNSVAAKWVKDNIVAYPQVSFKYIVVGNEIRKEYARYILPAMKNMWAAICHAGFEGKIKVSTAVKSDVFIKTYPPSKAQFNPSYNMGPIVNFLAETGNPLFVNIYPYFSYIKEPNNIRLDYALFTAPGTVVQDSAGYEYQNLFDAMVDSVYYAMEKAGYSDVGIVVSESGWPSAGGPVETTTEKNARTYNQNLINHVVNGTPKRPGYLETYIFAMFNENQKPGDAVEKNFGLFKPNKSPVYRISFN